MRKTAPDIRLTLDHRIVIIDGAMGTEIQALNLNENDFTTGQFAGCPVALRGNNDVLNLARPGLIAQIHRSYVDAGADIITTNTFNSNRLSQEAYGCANQAAALALAGAQIARKVADEATRPVWVAGSMGPTGKSLSIANNGDQPDSRATDFDTMAAAYREQVMALRQGGVDLLLLETCYDALNAKAALWAIAQVDQQLGSTVPVMVSATVNDRTGHVLTGQSIEAFFNSVSHYPILSFGLNCGFGVNDLRPIVENIARKVPVYFSLYPNAGLPNELGKYEETPAHTSHALEQLAQEGLINMAGGCCGTTPAHIAHTSHALQSIKPRAVPEKRPTLTVSGLETVTVDCESHHLTLVGERANVAGSRKFARLMASGDVQEALQVVSSQIENGAHIIDINMDDPMLNSTQCMARFVRHIESDPATARAALMIDSSHWPTLLAGLKNSQGKCIANSISLKEGEEAFLDKARTIHQLGAAVVVVAIDEQGQATTLDRKIAIARRACHLLTTQAGFAPQDIILDLNVLAVGTGIESHARFATDFIEGVRWVRRNLPQVHTSGGVSNLSFAFRGNNAVRQAMHAVFLYHAQAAGLDMAIVNPAQLQPYDSIDPTLRQAVDDVIMNRRPDATERLTALASALKTATVQTRPSSSTSAQAWRELPVEQRLAQALMRGDGAHLSQDIDQALTQCGSAVAVIEGPLMNGMQQVGDSFAQGKMFLPQIVKAAQVMKQAVAILQPAIAREGDQQRAAKPRIVLATVQGDVHDIGKNIVKIVLTCNNFEVIDLGVMVSVEAIVQAVRQWQPLLVGVCGLITPSLAQMEALCRRFAALNFTVPIVVGGATTSQLHTAVKLAPLYAPGVLWGGDASHTAVLAKQYALNGKQVIARKKARQSQLRQFHAQHTRPIVPFAQACAQAPHHTFDHGIPDLNELQAKACDRPTLAMLEELIDWKMLLHIWKVPQSDQATLANARQLLHEVERNGSIEVQLAVQFHLAGRQGNDMVLDNGTVLPMLRQQSAPFESLCDLVNGTTPVGLFAVAAHDLAPARDEYWQIMRHALCACLAEAAALWLHRHTLGRLRSIRPAFGYATCPDHSLKAIVLKELDGQHRLGIRLTESYSMIPDTSICGLLMAHPQAHYFNVGEIDQEQRRDYERRNPKHSPWT